MTREPFAATAGLEKSLFMAEFKVPREVIIVDSIPKGPTGKVQRVALATKFGFVTNLAAFPGYVAPRTPLESALTKHWANILQKERIGIHDNFFASGGDSL